MNLSGMSCQVPIGLNTQQLVTIPGDRYRALTEISKIRDSRGFKPPVRA
jgi:hypothetical protein